MNRLFALVQAIIVAAVLLGGAAVLGFAVRVFTWAAGYGG